MANELKAARGVAKGKVTIAIRKLNASLQCGAEEDIVNEQTQNLENLFDSLSEKHFNYLDITEQTDDDYLSEITESYNDVMKVQSDYIKSNRQIEKEKAAIPLRKNVERSFKRTKVVLERMQVCVKGTDSGVIDIDSLKEDRDQIDICMNSLLDDISKLGAIVSTESEDSELDLLITRADEVKRQTNIFLRKSKGAIVSIPASPSLPISPITVNTLEDERVHSPEVSKEQRQEPSTDQVVTEVRVTTEGSAVAESSQVSGTSPHQTNVTISGIESTQSLPSSVSDSSINGTSRERQTIGISSAFDATSDSHFAMASNAAHLPASSNVGYNTGLSPGLNGHLSSFPIEGSSGGNSMLFSQAPSSMSYGHLTSFPAAGSSGGSSVFFTQTQLPMSYSHVPSFPAAGSSGGSSVFFSQTQPPRSYSHLPSFPAVGSSGGRSLFSQTPSHTLGRPDFPPHMPVSSHIPQPYQTLPIYQTKKPPLPTFSGERGDWPEFKSVWRTLAEVQFSNRMQLATELKRACSKGRARERLKHIYVTSDRAYEEMWQRLSEEYDDPGLSVQAALERLATLKKVEETDYKGMVKLIDEVEGVHNMMKELGLLEAIHMADVDRVGMLLPSRIHMDWIRKYKELSLEAKTKPFPVFVDFLRKERAAASRMAESQVGKKPRGREETKFPRHQTGSHVGQGTGNRPGQGSGGSHGQVSESHVEQGNRKSSCVLHEDAKHLTAECRNFKRLSVKQRFEEIRKKRRCFKCFSNHPRAQCKAPSCSCGKDHHALLCSKSSDSTSSHAAQVKQPQSSVAQVVSGATEISTDSNLVNAGVMALYPIHSAHVVGRRRPVTVFMDGGSNASYVTERCAGKLALKKVHSVQLDVTTVGGQQKEFNSAVFEIPLRTQDGRTVKVLAYGLPEITGHLSPLDRDVLKSLFPDHDVDALMRNSNNVDLLIGTDYYGLHPKIEVARAGDNLSIMQGELGICIVGTHPQLKEETVLSKTFPISVHGSVARAQTHLNMLRHSHPGFSKPNSFFIGEDLGTESSPKCGGCKCGNCPLPGHDLSFREEQELHMIRSGFEYDQEKQRWITGYPWIIDPDNLPPNYEPALATLRSTERSLAKDKVWAKSYTEQMTDMLERGVCRKLSQEELQEWKGPHFYISHLAVVNPKSKSTPVRIVFNSSQVTKGMSLNGCLAKGPDSYRNSSLGILLRWREEPVAIVGDIRKMFHSVHLKPLEQHCHRFLWRELDGTKEPDIYVMERVNMGDRPAPAIATEALFMTADLHKDSSPKAAEFIQRCSYVDDLVNSVASESDAKMLAQETERVLASGGFQVKCWQMTGDEGPLNSSEQKLKGKDSQVSVLGVTWKPDDDTMSFEVSLNFSKRKHGSKTEPDLCKEQIPEFIPEVLTKRQVLQQVMGIYDPMGLISPFTLMAKIYLRETWILKLDWDDPLPGNIRNKWIQFFKSLFMLEDLCFPRCLRPEDAEGDPWLIILSDGSDLAYGCAAYVRWRCRDGSIKMRLIFAKSRIAPINKISTPRMELNGAVLSKRCRVVLEKEMRYKFERILHLVDSETILNMLNKTSCRFRVYEGVRIGEIQTAMQGEMGEWAWIPGNENVADWLTRGRSPDELNADSEWFKGPAMLHLPFEQWNVKFGKTTNEPLPGEKKVTATHAVDATETKEPLLNYNSFSSMSKCVRVVARIMGIALKRSFKGGNVSLITPERSRKAEEFLLLEAQRSVNMDSPDYRRLNPSKNSKGLWVVGSSRLAVCNPMSAIHADLPIFIPKSHPLARLAMQAAHENGHRGRDATLAMFRNRFWTPSGSSLAKSVRNQCQMCRRRDVQLMQQEMGSLPVERLRPSPPFNHVMIDLFGPYSIRGEVQKRTTGKAWGVLFTDLCSRAVHIEATYGYDTSSFLMALTRFASIRGWPEKIFSDPGTQMLGANREINEAAAQLGTQHGMQWIVGPADSPWRQGAVESLVKVAKRALNFAFQDQRLSAPEFLTACTEAANLMNERPIGLLPSLDSEINVLTPNCLLLGRANAANPSGWQPGCPSLKTRYHLVAAVGEQFWKFWIELFAPTLVYRPKWFTASRNLEVGDVVLVADSNTMRGEYKLARVTEVHPGKDGKVRSATVVYKNHRVGESAREYRGVKDTAVKRSVQRLSLLVPVDVSQTD